MTFTLRVRRSTPVSRLLTDFGQIRWHTLVHCVPDLYTLGRDTVLLYQEFPSGNSQQRQPEAKRHQQKYDNNLTVCIHYNHLLCTQQCQRQMVHSISQGEHKLSSSHLLQFLLRLSTMAIWVRSPWGKMSQKLSQHWSSSSSSLSVTFFTSKPIINGRNIA